MDGGYRRTMENFSKIPKKGPTVMKTKPRLDDERNMRDLISQELRNASRGDKKGFFQTAGGKYRCRTLRVTTQILLVKADQHKDWKRDEVQNK